jgi:hypothetical protein
MKCLHFLVVGLAVSVSVAEEFRGIEFPGGASSFADRVVHASPGSPAATDPNFIDASRTIGPPDYLSPVGSYSLGRGGSITLEFTNNHLTGSDDDAPDLHIFEIGPDIEDTFVEVSREGVIWESVGKVFGSTSSIDIDAFGFTSADEFRFVRLVDDPDEGNQTGDTVGADIDAVGALSTTLSLDMPSLRIRPTGSTAYSDTILGEAPVAYWRLNESSGTIARNLGSLGVAADGNYGPHATLDVPGLRENSIDPGLGFPFDSIHTGMLVEQFPMPTDALSFSFLLQGQQAGTTCLFGYGAGTTPNEFSLFAADGGLILWVNSTTLNIDSVDVFDGDPHQLTITWTKDGGLLTIYLDGDLAGSGVISDGEPIESQGVLALGQDLDDLVPPSYGFDGGQSFVGTVDEVAVFDKVLDPALVRRLWLNRFLAAEENYTLREFFLELDSASGSEYGLQESPDLIDWEAVRTPIEGTGKTLRWVEEAEDDFLNEFFYRILTTRG